MAHEVDEALASLEMFMCEFFAPNTNNVRKREIESMLENFSNRRDSWKHSLLFLQKSQNQYVSMFTLTTLENTINKQWINLSDSERTEIRLTLWNELMDKHETMVYFIRNKIAALIVSIARYDWPHLYPDFFDNIIQLMYCDGHKCLLALILAQASSEELGSARDTGILLPTARRTQLERLMLKGMPQMLNALSGILEKNSQKEGDSNPPPSPTSGIPQTSVLPDLLAHDVYVADKALNMEIVIKCLTTLQHLFSWLPLSSHVPPSLVTTVFYWGSIATQTQSTEAALAGLSGVCELLYRRYAPPSSATTALRLHHCSLQLLRHLTCTPTHMTNADIDYLNKLSEFLKLFVSMHFKRLEAEPEFDAIEFLSYLFQFTFQVPTCTTFISCLDIWIQFMDVLKPEDTAKYWQALQGLVNGVLNKTQFQHNKQQLQHLDNEICDDDGETEWQTFLKHSNECIARVAEIAPLDVFPMVMERWQCLAGVHSRLSTRGISPNESDRLLCALRDLASLTTLLGRLAPALFNEEGACAGSRAGVLCLLERCASAVRAIPHAHQRDQHIASTLIALEAEMFACLGAWSCYMSECGVQESTIQTLLTAVVQMLMPREVAQPPILCHSAAHLFLSLSKNVKLSNNSLVILGDLFNQAQVSLEHLETKSRLIVSEALFRVLSSAGPAVGSWRCWNNDLITPTHVLLAMQHENTHAKKILAENVQDVAESALRMLGDPAFASAECEITDFFLALFTTLMQQMGHFTYTAINCFLEVAERSGSEVSVDRLIRCVRLGVEGLGASARVTARDALSLALPHCNGALRARAELLHSILVNYWRYFFPNKCLDSAEEQRRTDELRTALTTLGNNLLDTDIEVFRISIKTLETLNTKWKLYHKAIFRSEFLAEFLSILLSGAGERGGGRALLREELLSEIHAMASVDFNAFRMAFLPHFLSSLQGLTPEHVQHLAHFPPDTDLPTFTQNIQQLMNDVNCYRAYNSLLPSGS